MSLQSRVIKTELINWKALKFFQSDKFKEFEKETLQKLKNSILKNSFAQPFYVWESPEGDIYCLDGKHRTIILDELIRDGIEVPELLPATFIFCEDRQNAASLVLVYSSLYATVTNDGLFDFVKEFDLVWDDIKDTLELPEFDSIEFESMFKMDEVVEPVIPAGLSERFIIPPFSIFDTRQGYWQDRKRIWTKLFDSQASREDVELIAKSGQSTAVYELRNMMREKTGKEPSWDEIIAYARKKGLYIYEGASIFDPVLTEVCYKWFCPEGGDILDPFAGGSVRGIVAGLLGFRYLGIDLRPEQVEANRAQAKEIEKKLGRELSVYWKTGDSNKVLDAIEGTYDFIFSCPPYHDLEKYSDDPADLSNMSYEDFCIIYHSIIAKSLAKLKNNRFACFVVGDIRDKEGFYKGFVHDTMISFTVNKAQLYNDIILVNVAGSLPVRVGRQFEGFRKVGKMHQNVLVFYKGDPKEIKNNFPEIKIEELVVE